MGKVYWPKTLQVQAEQGLQVSIKEPQMVKSLRKNSPCLY